MNYENGFNENEDEESNELSSFGESSSEPNVVSSTTSSNRSMNSSAIPITVRNKAKTAVKKSVKKAANLIGKAIRTVVLTMLSHPIAVIVAVLIIIALAAICWALSILSKDAVIDSVEKHLENSSENISPELVESFKKNKSLIMFKLDEINKMYDGFKKNVDSKDKATIQDMQKKFSGGDPDHSSKDGSVVSNESRELYKHLLMTEKYNFNNIEWKEYSHSKTGTEPAMETDKETGLRYPKKTDDNEAKYDEKYFTSFIYPYLQSWYIPLAMYSGSLNTPEKDNTRKNGQFAYQIISKAYSDILINKFVLEKKTQKADRYEYTVYNIPVKVNVTCTASVDPGTGNNINATRPTCTYSSDPYTDGKSTSQRSVSTDYKIFETKIDKTTQYKLVRALTFDRAFKFEYEYKKYIDSQPQNTQYSEQSLTGEKYEGSDPVNGYSYSTGMRLNGGAQGARVPDSAGITSSGTYTVGYYSYVEGSKYIRTQIWKDELVQQKNTGEGEVYKVSDLEDFINKKKPKDPTTSSTSGGTILSPEQIKALAASGMFLWPYPTQIGRYEKTYGDSDGFDTNHENGVISSWFGLRIHPLTGEYKEHGGIDIVAKDADATICAAKSGVVVLAGYNGGYGNCVAIAHDGGYKTLYGHMETEPFVSVGQQVTAGQPLGVQGSTGNSNGPHLHFEVTLNGELIDGAQFFNLDLTPINTDLGNINGSGSSTPSNSDEEKYVNDGQVIVVNKQYKIVNDPGKIQDSARDAYNRMNVEFPETSDGSTINIVSGYRSIAEQQQVWDDSVARIGQEMTEKTVARPEHSEHTTGLVFDVGEVPSDDDTRYANTQAGKWLANNAHKYGFIIRYPKGCEAHTGYSFEPWHIRFVGEDLARKIKESGKCLEEYFNIVANLPAIDVTGSIKLTDKAKKYYSGLEKKEKLDRLDFINATKKIYGKYIKKGQEWDENVGYQRGFLSMNYSLLKNMLSSIGGDPDNLPFVYGQSLGLNTKHTWGTSGGGSYSGVGIFKWPIPEQVGNYKMTDSDSDSLGVISSWFGPRDNPVTGEYQSAHGALDIVPKGGSSICAAASGTVVLSETNYGASGYGNYVIIEHENKYWTLYGHMLDAPLVSVGQQVTAGQQIGIVGSTGNSTGPHLHFEIRKDSNSYDTRIDPVDFFNEDLTPKGGGAVLTEATPDIDEATKQELLSALAQVNSTWANAGAWTVQYYKDNPGELLARLIKEETGLNESHAADEGAKALAAAHALCVMKRAEESGRNV